MKILFSSISLFLLVVTGLLSKPDVELLKIENAAPEKSSVKPKKTRKVLVYSHPSGFKHSSIPTGVKGLRVLAEKTQAFEATFTLETKEFTSEGLKKYDAIIPCGIKDKGITNLKQIKDQDYKELDKKLVEIFISNLNK